MQEEEKVELGGYIRRLLLAEEGWEAPVRRCPRNPHNMPMSFGNYEALCHNYEAEMPPSPL